MLTQERLKELLNYNPITGLFVRARNKHPAKAGDIAGYLGFRGYIIIKIDGKIYYGHRLAFFYMNGLWPENIDHIDHVRHNNKWANIRKVSHLDNSRNQSLCKHNKSGVSGVRWYVITGKWRAQITVNNNQLYLGEYADKFEAICVRKAAEYKYGFHENHGRKQCER